MKVLKKFIIEENGATAVEYAMIIGLIALVSFMAYKKLGMKVKWIINQMYMRLKTILPEHE